MILDQYWGKFSSFMSECSGVWHSAQTAAGGTRTIERLAGDATCRLPGPADGGAIGQSEMVLATATPGDRPR